jgi:hypothetical protein
MPIPVTWLPAYEVVLILMYVTVPLIATGIAARSLRKRHRYICSAVGTFLIYFIASGISPNFKLSEEADGFYHPWILEWARGARNCSLQVVTIPMWMPDILNARRVTCQGSDENSRFCWARFRI